MAIIALKAWYLKQYEPIREVIKKPCDLRLSRNSLLKSGLRVDFLDDRSLIEASDWFGLHLEGQTVEFYIEGSGSYTIANIDLVSQEIYFTKRDTFSLLEPLIYFSPQDKFPAATEAAIATLSKLVEQLNERSRIPLSLEIAPRPQDFPLRLSDSQLRKIRKSLLFIADTTPITSIQEPNPENTKLILDPNVCVEIGYAINSKDNGQLLLLNMKRPDLQGELPFDVAQYKQLSFASPQELEKTLPKLIKVLLQKFNLF